MDIKKAIESLTRALTLQPNIPWKLVVKTYRPGSIGGTPCVDVTQLISGFDWDNGKIMIETAMPLTTLSPEDVASVHKSAKEGQSWHAFQSYKKQADQIKALQAEIAMLKANQVTA